MQSKIMLQKQEGIKDQFCLINVGLLGINSHGFMSCKTWKHKQEVAHVIMENKIPHVKVLKKKKEKQNFM